MKFQGEKFMFRYSRSVYVASTAGQNYLQQCSIIHILVQVAFAIKNVDEM